MKIEKGQLIQGPNFWITDEEDPPRLMVTCMVMPILGIKTSIRLDGEVCKLEEVEDESSLCRGTTAGQKRLGDGT
jgi:hypothetical protein